MSSEGTQDFAEGVSGIVRIAYCQLHIMRGFDNYGGSAAKTEDAKQSETYMVCTRRLFRLPIFLSITSTFSNAYAGAKSFPVISPVLNFTEDILRTGKDYARPVTNQITQTLETPLRGIDNTVCIALDFLEEKIPSIKLPPEQIYENVRNLFSSISLPNSDAQDTMLATMKGQPAKPIADTPSETNLNSKN